jgi:hypothetical protein
VNQNTYDFACRSGKKRPLTLRNIRRIAERAITKSPTQFIKIIGDAIGLIKVFYGLTPEDEEVKNIIGKLFFAAKKEYAARGIDMPTPVQRDVTALPVAVDAKSLAPAPELVPVGDKASGATDKNDI